MKTRCDGSQGIIDEALSSMAADCAGKFDPPDPRPLGVLQEDGPHEAEGERDQGERLQGQATPHGRTGRKAAKTVPGG